MSSNIQVGTPILKGFTHQDFSATTSFVKYLNAVIPNSSGSSKRAICMIQNESSTAIIYVRFLAAGTTTTSDGIALTPLQSLSLDNYNGEVWVKSDTAASPFNTAESFA